MSNRFVRAGLGFAAVLLAVSCTKELTSVSELTDEELRKQAAKDSIDRANQRMRDSLGSRRSA